jgi:hypothetical protein
VERDVRRLLGELQHGGDLACREIGSVLERKQVTVTLLEVRDSTGDDQAPKRVILQIGRIGDAECGVVRLGAGRGRVTDAAAGDSDQPAHRLSPRRVIARAVAEGTLEHLARNVLRFGAVADAVRDIGVNPADQPARVTERIHGHLHAL